MNSFLELPRLQFDGREIPSLYVNTADIVTLLADYDGQSKVEIRGWGVEGAHATVRTYAPLGALLNMLGELVKNPAVRSWTDETKQGWRDQVVPKLQAAAEKERAASRTGH